jgi:uncharacterized integral membrane protein
LEINRILEGGTFGKNQSIFSKSRFPYYSDKKTVSSFFVTLLSFSVKINEKSWKLIGFILFFVKINQINWKLTVFHFGGTFGKNQSIFSKSRFPYYSDKKTVSSFFVTLLSFFVKINEKIGN